jgi:putative nucleotidyltransferase with HDIG domain
MQALDNYINEIKTLPPAPRILTQLLVLLNEDNIHPDRIVELIEIDPALTAKVLQRCNSADSGCAYTVSDLHEAITRVGFNEIYRMVAMVIGESLLGAEQQGYGIGMGELWEHSVTTAVAARVIGRKLHGPDNLAFTAGLLHDIGKLVLGTFLEGSQQSVFEKTGPSGLSFLEAEKAILGVEHAEIGGRLLARWNFPDELVKAVWHHHDPAQARPHEQLASYIHLGDLIAHCLGQAQGYESFAVHARAEALQILEINPEDMDSLVLETDLALKQLNGLARATS